MVGFVRKTLPQLFIELPYSLPDLPEIEVTGVEHDSRKVKPGSVFVALTGGTTDGHRYIPKAVEQGAAAVVGTQPGIEPGVPYIQVANAREALALLSASFYNFPARRLTVIGVTGTDGKTTTCNLIYNILMAAGRGAGIISTVNATIAGEVLDTGFHVTTPEAPDVQRYLARMVNAGLDTVVLEATSHGLAQHRVTGSEFDVAVVTNITHEHLDFHGSYEAYREAKGRLFTSMAHTIDKPQGTPRVSVLNLDDASYEYLDSIAPGPVVTYSVNDPSADLHAEAIELLPGGTRFMCVGQGAAFPVQSNLVGQFNLSNCLAAVGATVLALGIAPEAASRGIASMQGVPGRMEVIDLGQNFTAVVDFAHTPNALLRSLETARTLTTGRVIVVFGSAGLRDRQKRRMMAEVSSQMADLSIFTAEDPRTESLDGILEEMAQGAAARGGVENQTFWRIADRGEAIRFALEQAQPGDIVLACGKGHEQSMAFGEQEYAWDDRTAMRAALAQILGLEGPAMPYLPTQRS